MTSPQVPASVLARSNTFRIQKWHRQLATVAVVPLGIIVLTGGLYRVLRGWLNVPSEKCGWLLDIHVMSILGLEKIFPLIMGLLTILVIITSIPMSLKWFQSRKKIRRTTTSPRDVHRGVGICITIPLLFTALSGVGYVIGKHYIGADKAFLKSMMQMHQFSYFSPAVYYITILFAAGVLLLASGSSLLMGSEGSRRDGAVYTLVSAEQ